MEQEATGRRRTIRVLHAEDDESFRDLVADVLGMQADIRVESVATPEAAVDRLAEGEFDCIVSDFDGEDDPGAFLPVIEATEGGPPCILLTAKERDKIDTHATAGIDEYVRKGAGASRFDVLPERIRNHAERYRASERYRALFEQATGPMTVHDIDTGAIVDVNPQFSELLGYDQAETDELGLSDIMPDEGPYTVERAKALVERAAEGETVTEEWVDVTADGEEIPVEVTLKRMDVAGNARVVVRIRDIRGRKRQEAALERHRRDLERLHTAADQLLGAETHEAVYETTLDAAESVLLPSFCAVVAGGEQDLRPVASGGSDESSARPEDLAAADSPEAQALDTRETHVAEENTRLCVPIDGHGVLSLRGYGPDQEHARELTEMLASHAAVALDRADREQELQVDHRRMESLAAAFPDYAFFYDADGTYNEVWLSMDRNAEINLSEELVGKTVHDILDEDAAATVQETIDAVLADDEVKEVEYPVEGPNNTYRYEARAAPLPDDIDGESEVVLVARDVTTRYEYEQQLERQNERLDRFASMVSHDLRNPLNVIQGRLELIETAADDGTVAEHAASAMTAAERMDELIDDMLTVARTDEQQLSPKPVSLADAAQRSWTAVSEPEAELDIGTEATVRADESELIRLLENLFRNSVEHAGPDVCIRVERIPDGFAVADDGPGIPTEHRENVFESGFSTSTEGTGYGLDIVERVADAHDWEVTLVNGNDGARFEITGVSFAEAETEGEAPAEE
jgi:PAS domain S-box-containing protein